jgi:hypothetical protein
MDSGSIAHKLGVVPAKAGTHNHEKQLLRQTGAASVSDVHGLWLWSRIALSFASLVRDDTFYFLCADERTTVAAG